VAYHHHSNSSFPKMKHNFNSFIKLISKGLRMEFDKDGCKVNNVHGVVVVRAQKEKTYIYSMTRFKMLMQMWQSSWTKVPCFGMKNFAISIWQVSISEHERNIIAPCVWRMHWRKHPFEFEFWAKVTNITFYIKN
jgi:hypothetical protein